MYPAKQFCTGLKHTCICCYSDHCCYWLLYCLVHLVCFQVLCSTESNYTVHTPYGLTCHSTSLLHQRLNFAFIILLTSTFFIVGFKMQWNYRPATGFEYFTDLLPVFNTGLYKTYPLHMTNKVTGLLTYKNN